ncbi:efflux RND transporter periplasmic adaptor subunit [Pusillimonas minor]|uniref:Efflux RND transporter periplasmic adaptor subunit n=1 Tax=Pusillimonas minor TaxID=2697024 RepID=A0A842HRC1_9BURK|nr:efflux RND transporter periplasmic adaptor subunit [Pusillimonas minor]
MAKHSSRWKLFLGLGLVTAVGLWGWRAWQGPVVNGYQVEAAPLVQQVVATGRVVANSRAQVGSEITAVVVERRVREGDRVGRGDVLLVLRADALKARAEEARAALDLLRTAQRPQAQASLARTESQLAQAKRELDRRKKLLDTRAVTKEDVEQAENAVAIALAAARQARIDAQALAPDGLQESILQERLRAAEADLAKTIVRAQFDGTVLTRNVEPGDLVQPGKTLLEIGTDTNAELLVPIDERNLGVLKVGQPATVIADAYPDNPFPARISTIAPAVDPERGTVDVRLQATPEPDFLRQDMTITVTITTGERDAAIVVPNDALFRSVNGTTAVWRYEDGKLAPVDVTTGLRGQSLTEVTEGLAPKDLIARAGAAFEPGQRVRLNITPLPDTASTRPASTAGETPMKFN